MGDDGWANIVLSLFTILLGSSALFEALEHFTALNVVFRLILKSYVIVCLFQSRSLLSVVVSSFTHLFDFLSSSVYSLSHLSFFHLAPSSRHTNCLIRRFAARSS